METVYRYGAFMTSHVFKITLQLLRTGGIIAAIVLCSIYPFLPGSYDSLAMTLSLMAQALGGFGAMLVAPVGALWLAYEGSNRNRTADRPAGAGRRHFAWAAVIASSLVAGLLVPIAFASTGKSLGVITLAAWLYLVVRTTSKLRAMPEAVNGTFALVPAYLVVVPLAVVALQLMATTTATELSRRRAIRSAETLIAAIETYHARVGGYPASLAAVHADYHPGVVGVEKFYYAPNGDSYDLFFEQPRFLFDDIGTREFVVYNPQDEQIMVSHAAWILLASPDELETRQGWYSVRDGPSPHWRCFSFD